MKHSKKLTYNAKITQTDIPKYVRLYVPISTTLSVGKEEEINAYQKIGVCDNVYYFSTCSGYILEIVEEKNEFGEKVKSIVVQNDFRQMGDTLKPLTDKKDLKDRLLETGLNSVFSGEKYVILGSDDDYLNNDTALLNTYKEQLLIALQYLESLGEVICRDKKISKALGIDFGDVLGKEITLEDLYNLYLACEEGVPNIYKIITVSGESVKEPKVFKVTVGTEYGDLLDLCGGEKYPLKEYNAVYTEANELYGNVLDLKEEYKNASNFEKSHIAEELVTTRKLSNKKIIEFLKMEKKYGNIILDELVYGDYLSGKTSEDFNQVVTFGSKGMLLLSKKEKRRRKKYVGNAK